MDDRELRREFVEVSPSPRGIEVRVCRIDWDGPHTPASSWVVARSLPAGAGERTVEDAVAEVLADSRYFARCTECGERQPRGWMHDARICQGCAERNHGVVH